jgi:Sodium/calcium exchanger protein
MRAGLPGAPRGRARAHAPVGRASHERQLANSLKPGWPRRRHARMDSRTSAVRVHRRMAFCSSPSRSTASSAGSTAACLPPGSRSRSSPSCGRGDPCLPPRTQSVSVPLARGRCRSSAGAARRRPHPARAAGGEAFGEGIRRVVERLGVSQTLLGNTVIAAGVEGEEIARIAVPARRGRGDIALGNVVGTTFTSSRSMRACSPSSSRSSSMPTHSVSICRSRSRPRPRYARSWPSGAGSGGGGSRAPGPICRVPRRIGRGRRVIEDANAAGRGAIVFHALRGREHKLLAARGSPSSASGTFCRVS